MRCLEVHQSMLGLFYFLIAVNCIGSGEISAIAGACAKYNIYLFCFACPEILPRATSVDICNLYIYSSKVKIVTRSKCITPTTNSSLALF